MNQKQKVFEDNCGDDESFITILAMTISYLIITLFKTVLIQITGVAIPLIWLVFWWMIIAAYILTFYYIGKNKKE